MVHHLNQVSVTFRKDSLNYMQETTKTALRENVLIHDQMGKIGDKMEELEEGNHAMRHKCREQGMRVKEMEENEKILAKESYSSSRVC